MYKTRSQTCIWHPVFLRMRHIIRNLGLEFATPFAKLLVRTMIQQKGQQVGVKAHRTGAKV